MAKFLIFSRFLHQAHQPIPSFSKLCLILRPNPLNINHIFPFQNLPCIRKFSTTSNSDPSNVNFESNSSSNQAKEVEKITKDKLKALQNKKEKTQDAQLTERGSQRGLFCYEFLLILIFIFIFFKKNQNQNQKFKELSSTKMISKNNFSKVLVLEVKKSIKPIQMFN